WTRLGAVPLFALVVYARICVGRWFRHARRRQQAGREPFAPVERQRVVWPEPEEVSAAAGEGPATSEPPVAAAPEREPGAPAPAQAPKGRTASGAAPSSSAWEALSR